VDLTPLIGYHTKFDSSMSNSVSVHGQNEKVLKGDANTARWL